MRKWTCPSTSVAPRMDDASQPSSSGLTSSSLLGSSSSPASFGSGGSIDVSLLVVESDTFLFLVLLSLLSLKKSHRCFALACENICFSSLFSPGDVSCRGTSATQRQKFHTHDANQWVHNKSCTYGVPNINLSSFTCLLVDFGKVFCSSANKLQRNSKASSREDYMPQILTVLLEILRVYIWPLWPFVFCLSFVNNS